MMHLSSRVRKQSAGTRKGDSGHYQKCFANHINFGKAKLELGIEMTTRRQEKVARVIKEAVSDAITHHLNDPRIDGFISVTRVDVAPDMRNADVFLSIFGKDEISQNKTFIAIEHARSRIQSFLAHEVRSKFCPVLHFYRDERFKKTLETMRLIDEATKDFEDKDPEQDND